MARAAKKPRAPQHDPRLVALGEACQVAGMPFAELVERVTAAGMDSPGRARRLAQHSVRFAAIALRAVGLEAEAGGCDGWENCTDASATKPGKDALVARLVAIRSTFWPRYDRWIARKQEIEATGPSQLCGYICPNEVKRILDAEFGEESRAAKADENRNDCALKVCESAVGAWGFLSQTDGCAPDSVAHWQETSARNVAWCAEMAARLDAASTLSALRSLLDAVTTLRRVA